MEKRYTLILADGTELSGLVENGSYFGRSEKFNEALFEGNLEPLTVSDGEYTEVLHGAYFVEQYEFNGMWYAAFAVKTEAEQEKERLERCIADLQEVIFDLCNGGM